MSVLQSAARALALGVALAITSAPAVAEYGRIPPTAIDPASLAIDETKSLGRELDRNMLLRDDEGRDLRLGDLMGKPLLLVLSYYRCDGSCPTQNRRMAETLMRAERFRAGVDYNALTVSFDPNDGPTELQHFALTLNLPRELKAGWRLTTAQRPEELQHLLDTAGFKFFWSVRDKVFVHPNVFIVVNPDGRVARYLYGVSISPRDIELAVIEANGGRIASASQAIDFLTGLCFSYSFSEGRYVLSYPLFIAMGSLLFGVSLVVFSFLVYRNRRPRRLAHA